MKGAVERILDRCIYVGIGENRVLLTEERKAEILRRMDAIAAEGLRVLCLAAKYLPNAEKANIKSISRDDLEKDCGFLGLVGI